MGYGELSSCGALDIRTPNIDHLAEERFSSPKKISPPKRADPKKQ